MNRFVAFAVALAAGAALAACTTASIKPPAPEAASAPAVADETSAAAPTGPVSAADEAACREAVAKTAGAAEMTVLSAEASAGNAEIVMGVGPEKARWQCLLSGGKVAGIMEVAEEVKF